MSTWYKVQSYGHIIKPVEVVRFTDKSIWMENSFTTLTDRLLRLTDYANYYPTWEEAHAFLLTRFADRVARLKQNTQNANSILGQIKKMTKPV